MILEQMVCKALGHNDKTILLSQLPPREIKSFPSSNALESLLDITDEEELKNIKLNYCTRCRLWDVKQK